jgi:hypothetical protein
VNKVTTILNRMQADPDREWQARDFMDLGRNGVAPALWTLARRGLVERHGGTKGVRFSRLTELGKGWVGAVTYMGSPRKPKASAPTEAPAIEAPAEASASTE